jgi:uncharacterized membrane protein YbhN (UPF0104 family)
LQTTPTTESARADASPAWVRHARVLATLAILAALAVFGFRHAGELERLLSARPLCVAGMALCVLGVRVLHSEIIRRTLAELGHRLPPFEVFGLSVLSAVPNLLVPRSGFGALSMGLRARHGVPLAVSGSLALPLAALDMVVISAAGLAVQTLAFGLTRPRALLIAGVFAGVLVASSASVALRVRLRIPFGPPRLRAFVERLDAAWAQLRGSRSFVLRAFCLLCVMCALRLLRLALAFAALDYAPDFAGLAVASLFGDVMYLFALTPGALGLREAAIVYCAQLAQVTPAASLAVAILDRLVMTAVILATAQLCTWRLFRVRART